MREASLVAVLAPRTGKIIKTGLRVFEREENLLWNGVFHILFTL